MKICHLYIIQNIYFMSSKYTRNHETEKKNDPLKVIWKGPPQFTILN